MTRLLIVDDTQAFADRLLAQCQREQIVARHVNSRMLTKRGNGAGNGAGVGTGNGLDVPDVSYASVMSGRIYAKEAFAREGYLHPGSRNYAELRRTASHLLQHFREFQPDVVSINNGFAPLAQLAMALCIQHGATPLLIEAPIIPGAQLLLDPYAPFFIPDVNAIDQRWQRQEVPQDTDAAAGYLARWRSARETKAAVKAHPDQLHRLQHFVGRDQRPVVCLALQVVRDMSVVFNLPASYQQDYRRWVQEVIAAVPADWKLVIKLHPRCWFRPEVQAENVLVVDAINIHDVIAASDAVVTLCSNVGLETAFWHKPAIVFGRPFYAGKGLTIDADGAMPATLPTLLAQAQRFQFDEHRLLQLLQAVLDQHLWSDSENLLQHIIGTARAQPSPWRNGRQPFAEVLPAERRGYIELVEAYQALRQQGVGRQTALDQLMCQPAYQRYASLMTRKAMWLAEWRKRKRTWQNSLRKHFF